MKQNLELGLNTFSFKCGIHDNDEKLTKKNNIRWFYPDPNARCSECSSVLFSTRRLEATRNQIQTGFGPFLSCECFTGIHYVGETGSIIQDSVRLTLKFHSGLFEHICRSFTLVFFVALLTEVFVRIPAGIPMSTMTTKHILGEK